MAFRFPNNKTLSDNMIISDVKNKCVERADKSPLKHGQLPVITKTRVVRNTSKQSHLYVSGNSTLLCFIKMVMKCDIGNHSFHVKKFVFKKFTA